VDAGADCGVVAGLLVVGEAGAAGVWGGRRGCCTGSRACAMPADESRSRGTKRVAGCCRGPSRCARVMLGACLGLMPRESDRGDIEINALASAGQG
jgi:hypothetical protein